MPAGFSLDADVGQQCVCLHPNDKKYLFNARNNLYINYPEKCFADRPVGGKRHAN